MSRWHQEGIGTLPPVDPDRPAREIRELVGYEGRFYFAITTCPTPSAQLVRSLSGGQYLVEKVRFRVQARSENASRSRSFPVHARSSS